MSRTLVLSRLKTFVRTSLSDDFHLLGIALVLFVISIFHPWMIVFLVAYGWFFHQRVNLLLFVMMSGVLLGVLFLFSTQGKTFTGEMNVVWIEPSAYGERLTLRTGLTKVHMDAAQGQYTIGDQLFLSGNIVPYKNRTVPGGFDARRFHLASGVTGQVQADTVILTGHRASFYGLRQRLYEQAILLIGDPYIIRYVFGNNTFDTTKDALIDDLGIGYLFSLSGLHLYALLALVRKVMWRLDLGSPYQKVIEICVFLPFLYLGGFAVGTFRVLIQQVISGLNRRYHLGMNRLDRLFLVFYLMIVFKPTTIFEPGLPVTFAILCALVLLEGRYEHKTGYIKGLIISGIAQMAAFPLIRTLSLPLVFVMPLLVYVLSGPLFFLSLFTLLFPWSLDAYQMVTQLLENVLIWLEPRQMILRMPELPPCLIIVHLIMMIRTLAAPSWKRGLVSLMILMLVTMATAVERQVLNVYEVIFIDVGQGDSAVLLTPSCTIVIDAFKNVQTILRAKGIDVIDLLILSHSDNDHVAEAQSLSEDFLVKRLIVSPYDTYPLDDVVTEPVFPGQILECGGLQLMILGPLRDYGSPNNNSIVMRVRFGDTDILFTGDIEQEAETDLVNRYRNHLQSEILKVPHHGSGTSSSAMFIRAVNPAAAVISVGSGNKYGFPDQTVLQELMLSQIIVYRTDMMGSVIYREDIFGSKWDKYLPYESRFWYN